MDRMKRQCLGAVRTAFRIGMLISAFVPVGGMIGAVVIAAVGLLLLTDKDC